MLKAGLLAFRVCHVGSAFVVIADSFRPPAAASARCGRMPWTLPNLVTVAKLSACSTTGPSLDFGTSLLQARKPLKSSCCTHVMPCVFLTALLAHNQIALSIRRPLWVRRPMLGGDKASSVVHACSLFCSCCITTDNTS